MSAAEAADALELIGRQNLSLRRRLQADLLLRRLEEVARLAASCGWNGAAMIQGGQVMVDYGGALVGAEHGHFRVWGERPDAILAATLERFRINPRVIVDLGAGAGEVAILLARRYPKCRVIAVEASRERLETFEANLNLQPQPLENLEIAAPTGDGPEAALQSMLERGAVRGVDLLRCQAGADSGALAAIIRALAGRIALACITLSGEASRHAELLSALEAAGLVLLEKRSQPIPDPVQWLGDRLSGRGPLTCWFVARQRLARAGRGEAAAGPVPVRLKAWAYGVLDAWRRRVDPTDRRFEFERLYALKPDPWSYRTSAYESLKYRRTLQTAVRLRPQARAVLEIGCSVGVFTRMLARAFPEVTAVDLASEALRLARRQVARIGAVSYVRSDIRRLRLGRTYDLILCAEMLYYMSDVGVPEVLETLDRHLAPGGGLMTVMPHPLGPGAPDPFSGWNAWLTKAGFQLVSEEDFEDPGRPYLIRAYERVARG